MIEEYKDSKTPIHKEHYGITIRMNVDLKKFRNTVIEAHHHRYKFWRNKCVKHVIWVEEVWDIGGQGLGNTLGLKTQDAVAVKESK